MSATAEIVLSATTSPVADNLVFDLELPCDKFMPGEHEAEDSRHRPVYKRRAMKKMRQARSPSGECPPPPLCIIRAVQQYRSALNCYYDLERLRAWSNLQRPSPALNPQSLYQGLSCTNEDELHYWKKLFSHWTTATVDRLKNLDVPLFACDRAGAHWDVCRNRMVSALFDMEQEDDMNPTEDAEQSVPGVSVKTNNDLEKIFDDEQSHSNPYAGVIWKTVGTQTCDEPITLNASGEYTLSHNLKDEMALALASGGMVNAELLEKISVSSLFCTQNTATVSTIGTFPGYGRDTVVKLSNDTENPNANVQVMCRGTTGFPSIMSAAAQTHLLLPIYSVDGTILQSNGIDLTQYTNQGGCVTSNITLGQDVYLAGATDVKGRAFVASLYNSLPDTQIAPGPLNQLAGASGAAAEIVGVGEDLAGVAVGLQDPVSFTAGGQINTGYSETFAFTASQTGASGTFVALQTDPSNQAQCQANKPIRVTGTCVGTGTWRTHWGRILRTAGADTVDTLVTTGNAFSYGSANAGTQTQIFYPPSGYFLLGVDVVITANGGTFTITGTVEYLKAHPSYSERAIYFYYNDFAGSITFKAQRYWNIVWTGAQQIVGQNNPLSPKAHWRDEILSALAVALGPSLSMAGRSKDVKAIFHHCASEDGVQTLGELHASGFSDFMKKAARAVGKGAVSVVKTAAPIIMRKGVEALANHFAASGVVPTPLAAAGVVATPRFHASGEYSSKALESSEPSCSECQDTGHPFDGELFVLSTACQNCQPQRPEPAAPVVRQLKKYGGDVVTLSSSGYQRTMKQGSVSIPINAETAHKELPAVPVSMPPLKARHAALCRVPQKPLSGDHSASGNPSDEARAAKKLRLEQQQQPEPVARGTAPAELEDVTAILQDLESATPGSSEQDAATAGVHSEMETAAKEFGNPRIHAPPTRDVVKETYADLLSFVQTGNLPSMEATGAYPVVGGNLAKGIAGARASARRGPGFANCAMFPTLDDQKDVVILTLMASLYPVAKVKYTTLKTGKLILLFSSEFASAAINDAARTVVQYLAHVRQLEGQYYITSDAYVQNVQITGPSFHLALCMALFGIPNGGLYTGGVAEDGALTPILDIDVKTSAALKVFESAMLIGPFVFPKQNLPALLPYLSAEDRVTTSQLADGLAENLAKTDIIPAASAETAALYSLKLLPINFQIFVEIQDNLSLYQLNAANYEMMSRAQTLRSSLTTINALKKDQKEGTPEYLAAVKTAQLARAVMEGDVAADIKKRDLKQAIAQETSAWKKAVNKSYSDGLMVPGFSEAPAFIQYVAASLKSGNQPNYTPSTVSSKNYYVQLEENGPVEKLPLPSFVAKPKQDKKIQPEDINQLLAALEKPSAQELADMLQGKKKK